ncbi:MAG: Isochorismate synthase MenF [Chlamydiales bacterium]|nr:Isochorismate synthase MenF [Chlamydiales bacterium]
MWMQCITTWTSNSAQLLVLAKRFADLEGTALLYSGGSYATSNTSYLCLFPKKKVTIAAQPGCWELLQQELGDLFCSELKIPRWVGYLGYEMGCFADPDQVMAHTTSSIADSCFYQPTVVVKFDHHSQEMTLYAEQATVCLERLPTVSQMSDLRLSFCSDSLESYLEKIKQTKKWIVEGEVYQLNLSQVFHLKGKTDAFAQFEKSVQLNPAPFSAFLNCGAFSIVSTSPERFLYKQDDLLESRPIKGTAPRGKTPEEDRLYKEQLLRSEKERAELLMITDLMRNDLGKVACPGSVKTLKIWECEAYTNVFHLHSVIQAQIKASMHPVSLIRQLFPAGSITGCPKLSAIAKIHLLEQRARGIYTGSIGYFAENGDFDFNVAIRTLLVHPQSVEVQLGGAIVIDSDPIKEYEETLHKGHTLFTLLGAKEFVI